MADPVPARLMLLVGGMRHDSNDQGFSKVYPLNFLIGIVRNGKASFVKRGASRRTRNTLVIFAVGAIFLGAGRSSLAFLRLVPVLPV